MANPVPFFPHPLFSSNADDTIGPPRVLFTPHRYIQGKNVLDRLGHYLATISSRCPAVMLTAGGTRRFGNRIETSIRAAGIRAHFELFRGECSHEEIDKLVEDIRKSGESVDSVIAVGGGKCIDAGKCVAFRLSVPVVICPTIASTDAPCSATSVMYTPEGVGIDPEYFPTNPALVIVDTGIIAQSPIRHLVAGMGDALATGYEARTCFRNPSGRNMLGARPTIAAIAIAELCAKTVFENALAAVESVRQGGINEALERVIEANTLLSGVGFESGGLAAAHALAAGMTVIPKLHREYLHGELVAFGLLAHLVLEEEYEEAGRVARFLAEIGLPVSLGQLQLDRETDSKILMEAMTASAKIPFAANEPFFVTTERLYAAFLNADKLGKQILVKRSESVKSAANSRGINGTDSKK
jgi:glycerol dehydrogenase